MNVLYESIPIGYVAKVLDKTKPVFADFETLGLYGDVIMAQFIQDGWQEALIVEYPNRERLQNLLVDAWVVTYPISYDIGLLEISPRKIDDLQYACRTAYPLQDGYSLADSAPQFYVGIDKKAMQKSFAHKREIFSDEQLMYGALDVYALQWLWHRDDVQDVINNNLAYLVDIKNQGHALTFQHYGMPVIHSKWKEAVDTTEAERSSYQAELDRLLGTKDFNVKSWQQKQKMFPELPIDPKTGKVPTGEPAFKRLYLEANPDPTLPKAYRRQAYKLVVDTTKRRTQLQDLEKYRESYKPQEDPVRIRTFFSVAGAITGRYTSKGGDRVGYTNIQNIGRHFKGIFGYEESSNRSLVSADYSTAELIAGCEIFKVPTMRDLIMDGIDLHKAMASEITGKAVESITKEERQHAKAINFGYLFGMGIERFQAYAYDVFGVKLTLEECKTYKELYYATHPAIARYHKDMARKIKGSNFVVQTALGRKAKPDRYSDALNIPVQGTIAECTKMAINYLFEDYEELMSNVMLVNMVHDSIVIDTPDEYIEDVSEALTVCMKEAWKQISLSPLFNYHDLPMGVDIDVGKAWC